jgi:hypothetical protein
MTHITSKPAWFPEDLEWEREKDPGHVLDEWRETQALLDSLFSLAMEGRNEAFIVATGDIKKRVGLRVEHWEHEVRMRLEYNKAHDILTPFGTVLKSMMRRGHRVHPGAPRSRGPYRDTARCREPRARYARSREGEWGASQGL